ncbi:hypothetical protein BGX34_008547 [Mortierella sp. NVP85]|nr:hypothetical protein BGX34_008547 [Mortierella sp. NVP85]
MYFSQPPLPFEQQTASNMPLESYNTQTNCAQDVPHTQLQFLPPLSIPMPRDVASEQMLRALHQTLYESALDHTETGYHNEASKDIVGAPGASDKSENEGIRPSRTGDSIDNQDNPKEMLVQLANDEGAITTFDFTPVATASMITMPSQMPDQYIAQLVAADLAARSRQIAYLNHENQALKDQISKLERSSKENVSVQEHLQQASDDQTRLREEITRLHFKNNQLENEKQALERHITETTHRVQDLENGKFYS